MYICFAFCKFVALLGVFPDLSTRTAQLFPYLSVKEHSTVPKWLTSGGTQTWTPGGGGGVLGSSFAGYVPLASQNPYPIIVYSVASYRAHLSHFWTNVIVISRTEFNANRLLNIKTTAGTIFQPLIFLFLNPCSPEFSYPKDSKNLRPHSSNSTKNVTPL